MSPDGLIGGLVADILSEMALSNHVGTLLANAIGMLRIGLHRLGVDRADDWPSSAAHRRMTAF